MAKQEKFIAEAVVVLQSLQLTNTRKFQEKILRGFISGGNIDGEILTNILRNH